MALKKFSSLVSKKVERLIRKKKEEPEQILLAINGYLDKKNILTNVPISDVRVIDGVVVLAVYSSVIKHRIRGEKKELIDHINSKMSGATITDIRFQ